MSANPRPDYHRPPEWFVAKGVLVPGVPRNAAVASAGGRHSGNYRSFRFVDLIVVRRQVTKPLPSSTVGEPDFTSLSLAGPFGWTRYKLGSLLALLQAAVTPACPATSSARDRPGGTCSAWRDRRRQITASPAIKELVGRGVAGHLSVHTAPSECRGHKARTDPSQWTYFGALNHACGERSTRSPNSSPSIPHVLD